ncbi:MAG: sigma-70 family RNA polymerase sigma factor, partial [Planctomycetes bacterium]|nr:sigma-70 family RNA polymerase sigma factor [Planctomycetota bacterium]
MVAMSRAAFEQLVSEHHAAVFRCVRRLRGDDAAAADVCQDVFLRVLQGKANLEAARDPRAVLCWLGARLSANAAR